MSAITEHLCFCDTMYAATYIPAADTAFVLAMDTSVTFWNGQYVWDFGDGTGSTTEQFPVHTYATNGIYNVCLQATMPSGDVCTYCHEIGIDTAGNVIYRTDDDGFTVKVIAPDTTLSTISVRPLSINLYPNPAANKITVEIYATTGGDCVVSVLNQIGQRKAIIATQLHQGRNTLTIPIYTLTAGLYVISVMKDEGILNSTFIK